jgi:hypothetical protein
MWFDQAGSQSLCTGTVTLDPGRRDCSLHRNQQERRELGITEEQAIKLDILHLFKIEQAQVIRILNVGGYIGPSTRRELEYARRLGKRIEFFEEPGTFQESNIYGNAG